MSAVQCFWEQQPELFYKKRDDDMNNSYFNGYYSYEMGLIVEEKSIYNGPQPDFELISVPGRDGDVLTKAKEQGFDASLRRCF